MSFSRCDDTSVCSHFLPQPWNARQRGPIVILVANAPVTFGVFEMTEGRGDLPDASEVLDAVSSGGYDGIDLGPPGYLGERGRLGEALRSRKLALAGGYVPLHLTEADALHADLIMLDGILDLLQEGGDSQTPPRPTLADAGALHRQARVDAGASLDASGWRMLIDGLGRAVARCRERGLAPVFHHHVGTWVQTPEEIDHLLEMSDVGLCLDSGHLLLAGGDPIEAVERWGMRIEQVHVKDARLEVLRSARSMEEVWAGGAFCPLGEGNVDVSGFVHAIANGGYSGWVVVEQDRVLRPGESVAAIAEEQASNRRVLQDLGW